MSLLKIRPFSIDLTDTFTFANANITANLTSGNASLGNLATANYFSGNGSLLSSITGSNVSGQVGNALIAGTVYSAAQGNITSVGTLTGLTSGGTVNFTTASNVTLGAVGNLHITGGTAGYFLQTDGAGTLSWSAAAAGTGNANIAGSNTQIFFNNSNSATLGASANLTFDSSTNTLNVTNISANGAGLTSLAGANVTGTVANANDASYLGGTIASSYLLTTGTGSSLTAITGANVTGTVANATYAVSAGSATTAGTVTTNAQPNITSVGTLTSLSVTGNLSAGNVAGGNLVTANYFSGNGSLLTSITGSNVSGQVANALVAGTVYTNAQPNITSVGTLTSLDVTGNLSAGNVNGGNVVTANYFSGNGSSLTGVVATTAQTVTTNAQPNITSVGTLTSLSVTGNLSAGNVDGGNLVTANYFSGNGSLLTSITGANVTGTVANASSANNASYLGGTIASSYLLTTGTGSDLTAITGANVTGQVGNALVSGTVYTNAQPNITSVGTLTSLSVTGDISGANLTLTGNLIISGTTTTVNSTTTRVVDPIVEQGGGANGGTLNANDGKDRGTLLHYYDGAGFSAVDAFMGWDNSNGEFGFGSNVTVANDVATFNTYGNLRAGYFLGNGSQLTGVAATTATKTANGTSNVDIATASGNITMAVAGTAGVVTITATGVNIAGYANLGSGNLTTTGNVTASYVIANGSSLSSLTGANVTGTVANATYATSAGSATTAGTVTTNAQPNITSVGTLTSLDVTGNISAGNANLGNLATANYFSGNGSLLTAITGANVTGQVGNALVAGTVYTNAQPNITSVGSLANLTVTGNVALSGANVSLGAVGNLRITGGSANYYLKTDGNGSLTWESVPITTMNVDTFTGDGSWTMRNLTATPASINFTLVAIGGVFQPRDAYSVTTNVITFDDPPPNGAIVEVTTVVAGAAGVGGGGTSWTYSAVSANTSAVAGYRYIVDTSSANITITLPASATLGDEVMIIDGTGNASTHEITVDKNGGKIQGSVSNMTVTTNRAAFTLVYYNSTQGWILTNV